MIEDARLRELCKKIADERDPIKFQALVVELNQFFEEQRPTQPSSSSTSSTQPSTDHG